MTERQGQWLETLLWLVLIAVAHGWVQPLFFVGWAVSLAMWFWMGHEERQQRKARR